MAAATHARLPRYLRSMTMPDNESLTLESSRRTPLEPGEAGRTRTTAAYRVVDGGADPVDGPLRPTARLNAIGRQKYARATSQPFRRAAGVLRPVRARQKLG